MVFNLKCSQPIYIQNQIVSFILFSETSCNTNYFQWLLFPLLYETSKNKKLPNQS